MYSTLEFSRPAPLRNLIPVRDRESHPYLAGVADEQLQTCSINVIVEWRNVTFHGWEPTNSFV
ncbi:hypothetical protein EYZ11_006316 [Aspergillus tanneri]|uniref:Uncharacterized protein n=1 Tax=Aspergillus tanneri TaxID=1220188 RepID=A0A4S3JI33_9EURO|nr:hypothetical protein EYZ11_006316 [Aspergillus tanneri]